MRWWPILLLPFVFVQPRQEYTGGEACASCHESIAESYRSMSMSRTFDRVKNVKPIEDWTKNNRFYHKASDQHFVMTSRDGKYYQRRYQLDPRGREINSLEVRIDFAIGSGNHERDYFHQSDAGEILQMPVVWYAAENAWGMAPGYDNPGHEGFSRKINYRCVFCHSAYPRVAAGADRYELSPSIFPKEMPNGIDCERCHGPGAAHAAQPRVNNIVNPAKLSRKLQMDVCMQCHLETTSAPLPSSVLKVGRSVYSYRPGEPLEDYAAYFDYPAGSGHDEFNIVHQAYRLRKSQCFLKSEMTCTTCHDPHRREVVTTSKCIGCHTTTAPHGQDCMTCHMPKRRTDDVVHVVMTDHYIQRRTPKNPLAAKRDPGHEPYRGPLTLYFPEKQADLYMGLALSRGADVKGGIELLKKTADSAEAHFALGSAYASLKENDRAVSSYRSGLLLDPGSAEVHFNMGLALFALGKNKDALTAFQDAIRLKPLLSDAHVGLGLVEVRAGNVAAARANFMRAIAIDPMNAIALANLERLK